MCEEHQRKNCGYKHCDMWRQFQPLCRNKHPADDQPCVGKALCPEKYPTDRHAEKRRQDAKGDEHFIAEPGWPADRAMHGEQKPMIEAPKDEGPAGAMP